MQCNILFVFRKLPARRTAPSSELLRKMIEVGSSLPGTNWSPQLTTVSQVSIWTALMWFFTATCFENLRWHWAQLELFYQLVLTLHCNHRNSLVLSSCASSGMTLNYEICHPIYLQQRCLLGTNWSPQLPTAISASTCQSLRFTQIITLSQVSIWTALMWLFTATFFENMRWHWTQLELFHQSISFNIFITIIGAFIMCFINMCWLELHITRDALELLICHYLQQRCLHEMSWTDWRLTDQVQYNMLGVRS